MAAYYVDSGPTSLVVRTHTDCYCSMNSPLLHSTVSQKMVNLFLALKH